MTLHTGRHFLQIPGPTNVPDRVLRAIDMPVLDHRGPEFAALGHEVLAGIQRIFRTKQPVIIYPSSGTGAWEAAHRQHAVAGRHGAHGRDRPVRRRCGATWPSGSGSTSMCCRPTGAAAPTPGQIEARLKTDKAHDIKAVCVVHNETSTGVRTVSREVRKAIDRARHPALLMVDTISGLARSITP